MKNILVPTDFSENAQKASEYAAGLANWCGAAIHLVHACMLLEGKPGENQSMRDLYNKTELDKKKKELLYQQYILEEKYPAISTECRLFTGPVDEVLVQFIRNHETDLVVMGTKGASGISGALLGSVTASFFHKSPIPVLAIPTGYVHFQPANIVLATQSFEQDKKILDPVFEMADIFGVPVHVFAFESDNDSDIAIAQRTLKLEQYIGFLQKSYPLAGIQAAQIVGDDFKEAMEEYSKENHTGIICMATHKRNLWGKVFKPSLTKKIAFQTKIPLLAIPVNN